MPPGGLRIDKRPTRPRRRMKMLHVVLRIALSLVVEYPS
jgi:hypothetical protein